eukprot:1120976-Pelagomonas_calceolata.AAC.2
MLSEPVPSGAVPWVWGGQLVSKTRQLLLSYLTQFLFPIALPAAKPSHPNLDALIKGFVWQACRVSGWGCSECAMLAIFCLATKQERLPKTFCLVCIPSFRAGNAMGGPSVNFTGNGQIWGLTPRDWCLTKNQRNTKPAP